MAVQFRKGIDLNGQRGINAGDGSGATDLVTLQQMQAAIRGLDWKDSVRAASTGNLTLSAPQTVDGVALVAGDRVLVKDQTTAGTNGIYVVAAAAWTRAIDADSSAEVTSGMATTATEGTANGDKAWILITNDPITLGTTALAFAQLGGGGATYAAGSGLSLTGSTFAVVAGNGLLVDATNVRVDPSITARVFQADCAATTNPQTFTHGLGKRPIVNVVTPATDVKVYPDVTITTTTITVDWGAAPTAGEYRLVAVG